jgi:hypothetical protein
MPKETDTIVIVDKALPTTEMPGLKSTIKGLTPYPIGGTTKEDMPIEDRPNPI